MWIENPRHKIILIYGFYLIEVAHGKGKKGSGRSKGKLSARKSSDHRMILTKVRDFCNYSLHIIFE